MNKSKILLGVGFLVLLGAIYGAYQYPKSVFQQITNNVGSPTGSTFLSAKVAQINMAPSTGSATSSSILNTDASDRWIENGFASCNGLLTASTSVVALTVQAATTSGSSQGLQANANIALNLVAATSSYMSNIASSTAPVGVSGLWLTGSYLTFNFNATDTGACTVGVHYHAS